MKRSENEAVRRPDTRDDATPWKLYNRLIEGIPEDIAVRDYCLGMHWSYVEADCGMGVSFTCKGGARRACKQDLRGTGLREMAELAKSWCFEEATLGVAALNAYYARKELLDPLGATYGRTHRTARRHRPQDGRFRAVPPAYRSVRAQERHGGRALPARRPHRRVREPHRARTQLLAGARHARPRVRGTCCPIPTSLS